MRVSWAGSRRARSCDATATELYDIDIHSANKANDDMVDMVECLIERKQCVHAEMRVSTAKMSDTQQQEQSRIHNERLHGLKELEEAKAKRLQTQEWHKFADRAAPQSKPRNTQRARQIEQRPEGQADEAAGQAQDCQLAQGARDCCQDGHHEHAEVVL